MRLVVLGLSLSSSWGNGHATTFRALLAAMARRGHDIVFLERDKPWYAAHRDAPSPDYCRLVFYDAVAELADWHDTIAEADAIIVGSYVPEGIAVGRFVQGAARGAVAFYDIDTPVTLAALASGTCAYLSPELVPGYDLYLSFTGGLTLARIEQTYGSPVARALYCSVDEARYVPTGASTRWDLSYLGTYSADRQPALERLLLDPARAMPHRRFAVAGPQYPADIRWPENVERIEHLPPADHPDFYSASRLTLNVTRADMIAAGWSPSVRLFEAAACATPILSDVWEGLDTLFDPGRDILLAKDADDVAAALARDDLATIGASGRSRVVAEHSATCRARQLEALLLSAAIPSREIGEPAGDRDKRQRLGGAERLR